MSINTITYTDKQQLNANPSVADINKVQATDMNEIKSVVNDNATLMGDLTELPTTDKTSIVNSISEINTNISNLRTLNTGLIAFDNLTATLSSISGNSYLQITVDTSKTGYAPIGIIGIGTSNQVVGVTSWRNYSSSTIFVFRNFSSSSVTNITAYIRVLYIKTSW